MKFRQSCFCGRSPRGWNWAGSSQKRGRRRRNRAGRGPTACRGSFRDEVGEDGALPKMLPREGAPRDAQQRGREGGATAPGAGPCPLSRTGTPSIGLGHTGAVEAEMSSPIITCLCGQAGRMVAGREHDWEVRGVSMGSRADCGAGLPCCGLHTPSKILWKRQLPPAVPSTASGVRGCYGAR